MQKEQETLQKNDELVFFKSPQEEAVDQEQAEAAIQAAQEEIKEVVQLLLDHTNQGVGYLFSDQNTFRNALIIDWSAENAEQYLKEKEEKERKLLAGEMGDWEAAQFTKSWISFIEHHLYRTLLRIYTPGSVSDEELEEEFVQICRELNEQEEAERIQARCENIAKQYEEHPPALDGDGMYASIVKRAEDSLNRADRRMKNRNRKKE